MWGLIIQQVPSWVASHKVTREISSHIENWSSDYTVAYATFQEPDLQLRTRANTIYEGQQFLRAQLFNIFKLELAQLFKSPT